MSNKTSIKSKFVGFIVVAVAVAAGFYFLPNYGHPNGKPDRTRVLLSVTFTPEIRDFNVWMQVSVAGVLAIDDRTRHSPWERTIEVAPGSPVRLVAVQYRTGILECSVESERGPKVARRIDFPGEIICMAVAH